MRTDWPSMGCWAPFLATKISPLILKPLIALHQPGDPPALCSIDVSDTECDVFDIEITLDPCGDNPPPNGRGFICYRPRNPGDPPECEPFTFEDGTWTSGCTFTEDTLPQFIRLSPGVDLSGEPDGEQYEWAKVEIRCCECTCDPEPAESRGFCPDVQGYRWDGCACEAVTGCTPCVGAGCYDTMEGCEEAHEVCPECGRSCPPEDAYGSPYCYFVVGWRWDGCGCTPVYGCPWSGCIGACYPSPAACMNAHQHCPPCTPTPP